MPRASVTSRCWASTSSEIDTAGKPPAGSLGAVLGADDGGRPKWPGRMMK